MNNKIKYLLGNRSKRALFLKKLSNKPNKVLELGCGTVGNYHLVNDYFQNIEYHGVDILEKEEVSDLIVYKKVDLNNELLPYPDCYFDVLIFTHVIEHLIDYHLLSSEINRVLKKTGSIYIETPNWTSILVPSFGFKREQHSPLNFYDDPSHIRPFTKHSLFEFLFSDCKLKVIKVGNNRNWLKIILDIPILLYGVLSGKRTYIISSIWNIYGWCIYGVARKEN